MVVSLGEEKEEGGREAGGEEEGKGRKGGKGNEPRSQVLQPNEQREDRSA